MIHLSATIIGKYLVKCYCEKRYVFWLFTCNCLLYKRNLNGLSLEGILAPDLGKLSHLRIL